MESCDVIGLNVFTWLIAILTLTDVPLGYIKE